MANRRLTDTERAVAHEILATIRKLIAEKSGGNQALEWAMRRMIYTRMMHDERGTPMHRRALKQKVFAFQKGKCPICKKPLAPKDNILDRIEAMPGYVEGNVRLLCRACDFNVQNERKFA